MSGEPMRHGCPHLRNEYDSSPCQWCATDADLRAQLEDEKRRHHQTGLELHGTRAEAVRLREALDDAEEALTQTYVDWADPKCTWDLSIKACVSPAIDKARAALAQKEVGS